MPKRRRIGQDLIDQRPKFWRVIELDEVAELMHDHVVAQVGGQEQEAVIEGKVAVSCAAPPARLLIANADTLPGYAVEFLKIG